MVMVGSASSPGSALGDQLRHWRRLRRLSQLDLASAAGSTPRYVSFVESGRARPSRQMIERLARTLDVPLRDRNVLLLAGGYAPSYAGEPLDSPQLRQVSAALTAMLEQHDPLPAVVLNRSWDVLRANQGAQLLFGRLCAPEPMPEPANVLEMVIGPGPVRRAVRNWDSVVPHLLERARREAVGGVLDDRTAELVRGLRARSDVAALLAAPGAGLEAAPVVDVRFEVDGVPLNLFSVVSTIGTPIDVTAQELRLESFFPSDDATRENWSRLRAACCQV
ncbi:helix-turn-helix transcriptional regulator [Frankia sp. CNm7]|uniref:Helix-turn-helix transcriptional regulator n=1 Tax=Frankia nepalensis TaxID=1836974 RepID=A0A937RKT1_9ACTN|nr:helix-turn-helix transcriptional regulator [Frankia nepalensis]MBL7498993.1 helix-turn-helix transcriptional regulator [Frankia nepalensis]MBL7511487.1 helix-turn-helix transcriptional regulator [Frankia nepalensis]MBL7520703.1 helix-turn-helix transcriptional regulator [Frankia nepalensis]MBL7630730.1 helix-turn-helix transcriptional regulator [Frankia nepalensis]